MALGSQVTVAQLMVLLRANTAQYDRAMTGAMGTTQKFFRMTATQATQLGRAWSYSVTLPLAIAGAAAVKTSLDFNRSMTKIAALTGLPASAVQGLEKEMESLSSTTAQTQNELAEAAYFIASSGFRNFSKGGDGLKILEMSAQGAMVGMGEAMEVADLLTSVMNAYGAENINAAQTMDILTAAVREGKAEPEEFARAMGRGLAVAQASGVEFNELAATVAALSASGISAQRGITYFEAVLRDLQKPSKAGAEALDVLKISADDVREALSRDFLGTLQNLRKEFDANGLQLRDLFKNSRAYNAVLDLTGEKLEEVDGIFKRVRKSVGDFNASIRITAESDAYKAQQALTDMNTALKDFGDALWPIVQRFARVLAMLAKGFSALPAPLQGFIGYVVTAIALFGPFLLLWVKYRIAVLRVIVPLKTLGVAAATSSAHLSGMSKAAHFAGYALGKLRIAATLAKAAISVGLFVALDMIIGKLMEAKQRSEDLAASFSEAIEGGPKDLGKQIRVLERDLKAISRPDLGEQLWGSGNFFGTSEYGRALDRVEALKGAIESLGIAAEEQTGSQQQATLATAEYMARVKELHDLRTKDQSLIGGLTVSSEDLTEAEEAMNEARVQAIALVKEYGEEIGMTAPEIEKLTGNLGNLGTETEKVDRSTQMMTGHISAYLRLNREDWQKWRDEIVGAVSSFEGVLGEVLGNLKLTGNKIADTFEDQFEHMDEFVQKMREAAGKMPKSLFVQLLQQGPSDPKGAVHFLDHYLDEDTTRKRINQSIRGLDRLGGFMGTTVGRIDQYGMNAFSPLADSARKHVKLARDRIVDLEARRSALLALMRAEPGMNRKVIDKIDEEIDAQQRRIRRLEGVKDGVGNLERALEGNKSAADDATVAMDGWSTAVAAGVEEAERLNEKMRPLLTMLGELQGASNVSFSFSGPEGAPTAAGLFGGSAASMANMAIAGVPGDQVISSLYRPWDTGSFHADPNNPAADIAGANLPGVFGFLLQHFAGAVRELIYGHTIVEKGRIGFYAPSDHFDHVHVADQGGMFKGPGLVRIGAIDEAVFRPAKKIGDGGGGDTYNITVHAGTMSDEKRVAREIVRVIEDRERLHARQSRVRLRSGG